MDRHRRRPRRPPPPIPPATPTGSGSPVQSRPRPFPKTDFQVFRGRADRPHAGDRVPVPIGKKSPVHRFRTMPAKATDTFTSSPAATAASTRTPSPTTSWPPSRTRCSPSSAATSAYDNGTLGRQQPRLPPQLQPSTWSTRKGRLIPLVVVHRQPRGRRRLQGQAAPGGPVLLRRCSTGSTPRRATPRSTSATT